MAHVKRVYKTDEIAHLWANQSTDYARNPQGNLYFSGNSIYSYGNHYELGRLVECNGRRVALINDSGYSVTTSKHISKARCAVIGLRLNVGYDGNMGNVKGALVRLGDSITDRLMAYTSELKPYHEHLGPWREGRDRFNETCKNLGFADLCIPNAPDLEAIIEEHLRQRAQRNGELKDLAQERAKKQLQELLPKWRAGQKSIPYKLLRLIPYHVLRVQDSEVITSGGARVPLAHALRLLDLVERGQAKAGARIGHYKFDKFSNGIVTIGCHSIELSEALNVLAPYRGQSFKVVGGA